MTNAIDDNDNYLKEVRDLFIKDVVHVTNREDFDHYINSVNRSHFDHVGLNKSPYIN